MSVAATRESPAPESGTINEAGSSGVDGSEIAQDTDDSLSEFPPWNVVARRFRKEARITQRRSTNTQPMQSKTNERKRKVFGTRQTDNSNSSSIKAGVDIVHKSVVQIDNLSADCTPALLTDYLLANEIPVLTCHKTKSWLRSTDEREKVTAFRVCVNARDHSRIKDASLWSKGIVIRDWIFRRYGSSNHGEH